MKPERIKQLRELCEKATPGPWEQCKDDPWCVWVMNGDKDGFNLLAECGWIDNDWNAAFIAAARTAVPELLDEVERLRRGIDRALEQIEQTDIIDAAYTLWRMAEDWKEADNG